MLLAVLASGTRMILWITTFGWCILYTVPLEMSSIESCIYYMPPLLCAILQSIHLGRHKWPILQSFSMYRANQYPQFQIVCFRNQVNSFCLSEIFFVLRSEQKNSFCNAKYWKEFQKSQYNCFCSQVLSYLMLMMAETSKPFILLQLSISPWFSTPLSWWPCSMRLMRVKSTDSAMFFQACRGTLSSSEFGSVPWLARWAQDFMYMACSSQGLEDTFFWSFSLTGSFRDFLVALLRPQVEISHQDDCHSWNLPSTNVTVTR